MNISDIRNLGTICTIGAHPDDETFTAAGIMAAAADAGQKVICVTATKGEAGTQDVRKWPSETLGEVRHQELMRALDILGVSDHYWLGYPDGECAEVAVDHAVQQLIPILQAHQPDTILTFGPEGLTGHTDHATVSTWATEALKLSGRQASLYHAVVARTTYEEYLKLADMHLDIFFNIDRPPIRDANECDLYIQLSPELQVRKCRALQAMPSQTESMLKLFDEAFLCNAFSIEAFVKGEL